MSDRFEACRVPATGSLRDSMNALERGATGIALVVNDAGRLLGTLTDGDIRRALLGGATLDSPALPYIERGYASARPGEGRAAVLELMQARGVHQIPVIDSNGTLLGLHLIRELLGMSERPNWAVVMAGGRGSRLGPVTEQIPKPMIAVAGRPILERIVLHLVSAGFRRVYLAVNYLADVIETHFADGSRYGCRIEYLRETNALGTAGALALLPTPATSPTLVMNGDLVTQADLAALLGHHERHSPAATMAVRRYSHAVPFGCVEVRDGKLVSLEEKPSLTCLVNAGMYVLDPSVIARVPSGRQCHMPELVEECLARGEAVHTFEIEGDWLDVGQPSQLQAARQGEAK